MTESTTKIVGITGHKRSGKDTFCLALHDNFLRVIRLAIADEIKSELARFLGISINRIEEFKEPYYRKPLQDLGTARRELRRDYWLDKICDAIRLSLDLSLHIVVSDVRLPLEATELRNRFDAKIVRLHRSDQGLVDDHETERLVDEIQADENYTCTSPQEVVETAIAFGLKLGWERKT